MQNITHIDPIKTMTSNTIDDILVKPIFKNQRVYLIGGGPSLTNLDWNKLKDKNVIAINKACTVVQFAQVLYFSDLSFYEYNTQLVDSFKGLIYSIKQTKSPKVIALTGTGLTGLELKNGSLRHGHNSGYAAINLAVQMGANEIILLGYDMTHSFNKSHFHDGYTYCNADPTIYKKKFINNFSTLIEPLNKLSIKIYNTSLDSELRCFPIININNFF